jgi:hypothetical protein
MMQERNHSVGAMNRSRKTYLSGAIVILAVLGLTFGPGCNEEEALTTFRDAATSSMQDGFKTIMNGFIDGLFAVLESNTTADPNSTTP